MVSKVVSIVSSDPLDGMRRQDMGIGWEDPYLVKLRPQYAEFFVSWCMYITQKSHLLDMSLFWEVSYSGVLSCTIVSPISFWQLE